MRHYEDGRTAVRRYGVSIVLRSSFTQQPFQSPLHILPIHNLFSYLKQNKMTLREEGLVVSVKLAEFSDVTMTDDRIADVFRAGERYASATVR